MRSIMKDDVLLKIEDLHVNIKTDEGILNR